MHKMQVFIVNRLVNYYKMQEIQLTKRMISIVMQRKGLKKSRLKRRNYYHRMSSIEYELFGKLIRK